MESRAITMKVRPDVIDEIDRRAARLGWTRSAYCGRALEALVDVEKRMSGADD